jgi:hypothetical protein
MLLVKESSRLISEVKNDMLSGTSVEDVEGNKR